MTHPHPDRITTLKLHAALTPAELDVARLVSCGLTNSAIATRIYRSQDTVKCHIRHLLRKTGATTRSGLVIWMYESGHVVPGQPGFPDHARRPASPPPLGSAAERNRVAYRLHRTITAARTDVDAALTRLGTL
ncbi:helix-turn-helix transcriptional regulator [Saccharopolyspora sp. NPDC047091]|uniref:response regulator transcription factor n=1 Tax=Saccharopolyspora sp. NPDC047091 TaxID=3155924 RepID=UPI0033F64135